MEGLSDGIVRVDDEAVCHVKLLPTDYGYCANHTGDDLFAEARVGPALVQTRRRTV